jgi:dUTPase
MSVRILVEVAPPQPEKTGKSCGMSVEDKVRHALQLIDSGYRSDVEWSMINRLYKSLLRAPKNERTQSLIEMIKPVLAKFGYHEVTNVR